MMAEMTKEYSLGLSELIKKKKDETRSCSSFFRSGTNNLHAY